jgi:hypothetical protein
VKYALIKVYVITRRTTLIKLLPFCDLIFARQGKIYDFILNSSYASKFVLDALTQNPHEVKICTSYFDNLLKLRKYSAKDINV